MSELKGRFVWYELLTSDPRAAKAFYTEVIGWGLQDWKGPMPYTMWTRGATPVGGVMELPAEVAKMGAPSHWLPYVGTPSVDGTVEQAKRMGAKIHAPPMDIPDVGRFAVLADPQGAVFAVASQASPPPELDSPPEKGNFSWHELATTDHVAAFEFYRALFGWSKTEAMDMGPGGLYQMYGTGGRTLGGMYNKPAEMPAPPHWLLYVRVDNVHRVAEVVKRKGGKVLNGPMEVPGGDYIAQCMDPQGAAFAIHHVKL